MFKWFKILAVFYALLVSSLTFAATLMPPGKQTFLDANGEPLAGGQVFFYTPGTTTPKNTWQDANQSVINTNPVVLDSAGRAIIYGSGSYRQIVKDSLGNTIWDQVTASTAEVSTDNIQYYATSVGGAANAIAASAITPADYSLTTGKTLRFISPLSNTGSTTLNPITLGAVTIKRVTTTAGTANLAGGELISGGVYDVLYDGTNYILLNPSVTDNPGDVKPFFGSNAPNGYVLAYGQEISRTTYAPLFTAISTNCGAGNGSTTFNVCDLRGRTIFGKDDMGGVAANRVTASSGITGSTLAATGGNELMQQHNHTGTVGVTDPGHNHTQNAHNHGVTDPGHSHVISPSALSTAGVPGTVGGSYALGAAGASATQSTSTGISINNATAANNANTTGITATTTINNAGSGASQNMPPTMVGNYIMRL